MISSLPFFFDPDSTLRLIDISVRTEKIMAKHDLSSADEEENVGGSTSTSNGNRKRVRIDSSLPPSSPPPTQSAMSAGIEDATSPRVNGHAPGNDEEQDEPSTDEDQDAEDRQELERTKKSDKAVGVRSHHTALYIVSA